MSWKQTFSAVVPDEAGRYEALYGFSRDFIELHIPLVIWHIENMELHKLNTTSKQNKTYQLQWEYWSNSILVYPSMFKSCTQRFFYFIFFMMYWFSQHTLQLAGLLSSGYLTDSQDSSISPAQHSVPFIRRKACFFLHCEDEGCPVTIWCNRSSSRPVEFLLWECQQWLLWCWWQLLQEEAAHPICGHQSWYCAVSCIRYGGILS